MQFPRAYNHQIAQCVVQRIPVFVDDTLGSSQAAPKALLHDVSVLPHDAFAYSDDLVALSLGFITSVFAHIGVGALATPGMVALLGLAMALGA
jgi:hypothetical protein